jgi:nucleoside-diphosphate-sugar epimerase
VRAFVRYNSRADAGLLRLVPQELSASLEVVAGDLREWQAIRQVVRGRGIVFHLGALISIPYFYHHPFAVAETNFMGSKSQPMITQSAWASIFLGHL